MKRPVRAMRHLKEDLFDTAIIASIKGVRKINHVFQRLVGMRCGA